MSVAVVTDSSAYLPDELVEGYGIHVVPLYVVLAGRSGREGWDISPTDVARALAVRGQHVSTSRPTPGDFVAAYRRALDEGAGQDGECGCAQRCEHAAALPYGQDYDRAHERRDAQAHGLADGIGQNPPQP